MNHFLASVITILLITLSSPVIHSAASSPTAASRADGDWIELTLETAGSLGVEILYQPGIESLSDVTYLRLSGPINATDWTTLKGMSSIIGLDLSGTNATSIPEQQFRNRSSLTEIILPERLKSIGSQAFYQTHIREITIPEGVTVIPDNCFCYCYYLTTVNLPATLTTINTYAFYSCDNLSEITLPESLTYIGNKSFQDCNSLSSLNFPQSLRTIGYHAFYNTGLTAIELPASMTLIDGGAFAHCNNLTEVTLPQSWSQYYTDMFSGCTAITKVTCPHAVPPADLFDSSVKPKATLIVPEFAIVDYKISSSWRSFKEITGGAAADRWTINGTLSLTNGRRMDGTPSLNVTADGKLTVGGEEPMPVNKFQINTNLNANPQIFGQLMSNCHNITAESLVYRIYLTANKWFFISLPFAVSRAGIYPESASTGIAVRYYDGETRGLSGAGQSWKNVAEDAVIPAGQGFIVNISSSGWVVFNATEESRNDMFIPDSRTTEVLAYESDSEANKGWNLIGNPYPTYFDMYYTALTTPVTVYNTSNNNYTAYTLIDDNLILSPYQAFFIQQTDGDGQVTFDKAGRQFTTEISRPENRSVPTVGRIRLDLTATDAAGLSDRTRIALNPAATAGYDTGLDAAKFFSGESIELYTLDSEGNSVAINELPDENRPIPLLIDGLHDTFVITAERCEGTAILHDGTTGREITLTPGASYSFETDGSEGSGRFTLLLSAAAPTGISAAIADGMEALTAAAIPGGVAISGAEGSGLSVFTPDGRMVKTISTASATENIYLPAGLYIIKAGGRSTKVAVKH